MQLVRDAHFNTVSSVLNWDFDGLGGAAVTAIGNGNRRVIDAIKNQLETMAC